MRRQRPRLQRRTRLSSASPARREATRTPAPTPFCSGRPVSATSCRATACCTWSALPPARTFSARRRSCPRTRSGPRPWRWARRSTRRHRASAAAPRMGCGRSISTATRSRSCRGRRTAAEWSAPSRSRRTARSSRRSVPGQTTGDGKANAIVALDPKTLQVKDWFSQPTAEFVTGPTILRHNDKNIVAAATKDGRVLLLDCGVARRLESRHAARGIEAIRRSGSLRERGSSGRMAGIDRHVVDSASRQRPALRR